MGTFRYNSATHCLSGQMPNADIIPVHTVSSRWDKGDILSRYFNTGTLLQPVLRRLEEIIKMHLYSSESAEHWGTCDDSHLICV